jgi:hypothetical protein
MDSFLYPFFFRSSITGPCIERLLVVGQIDAIANGLARSGTRISNIPLDTLRRTLLGFYGKSGCINLD